MLAWLKKNGKSIALVVSLVLNALGGSGVIPPVVGKVATAAVDAASQK